MGKKTESNTLEKSWDDSRKLLLATLNGENLSKSQEDEESSGDEIDLAKAISEATDLEDLKKAIAQAGKKSKKGQHEVEKGEDDEDAEDADREDMRDEDDGWDDKDELEDEETGPRHTKKTLKRSMEDEIDDDPEVRDAVNVEPFLRKAIKMLDQRLGAQDKDVRVLVKMVKSQDKLIRVLAKALIVSGDLSKATRTDVALMASTPVRSLSQIRGSSDKFSHVKGGLEKSMTRQDILDKALKLRQSNKMDMHTVTLIEGRLNKGMDLPEFVWDQLLADEKEGK